VLLVVVVSVGSVVVVALVGEGGQQRTQVRRALGRELPGGLVNLSTSVDFVFFVFLSLSSLIQTAV
jgi:hypothetical protein